MRARERHSMRPCRCRLERLGQTYDTCLLGVNADLVKGLGVQRLAVEQRRLEYQRRDVLQRLRNNSQIGRLWLIMGLAHHEATVYQAQEVGTDGPAFAERVTHMHDAPICKDTLCTAKRLDAATMHAATMQKYRC